MKRKTKIGIVGLIVLAFCMFWGVVFSSMGDFVYASLWTGGWFAVLLLLLILSAKGREKEGAYVKVWNIGGWVGIILYGIVCVTVVMPKCMHFFAVNGRSAKIQQLVSQELVQTDKLFQDYKRQAVARANQLKDNLENEDMTSGGKVRMDSLFSNKHTARRSGNWYTYQKDAFQERLLKPEYETHYNNWSANRKSFKEDIAEGWMFVTATQNVNILHNNIRKAIKELEAFYNNPIHAYEKKYIDQKGYEFKYDEAQLMAEVESEFSSSGGDLMGFVIFLIAFALSCFPFIFVRVNHIEYGGEEKDSIYKEGFELKN